MINKFIELVKISSESLKEEEVSNYIKAFLKNNNIDFYSDEAFKNINGTTGNIIIYLKGNVDETVLFSAHMDTVNPCININPVIEGDIIKSDGKTILGADDKGGIAVLLELILFIKSLNGNHKNVKIVFSVAEEIGLHGAKNLDMKALGKINSAYILDGEGTPGIAYNMAPYSAKGEIIVIGREAHAGVNPEDGINALSILVEVLKELKIGRIDKDTTCNIGKIEGGLATNIVMPELKVAFEARSLYLEKLEELINIWQSRFEKECINRGGVVKFNVKKGTPGFNIDENSETILNFKKACKENNIQYKLMPCGGGCDANIYNKNEIESINIAIGIEKAHTKEEYINIKNMEKTLEIVKSLIV